jgi:glycosyltransferase involved in cell wall biosynthesis
VARSSSAPESFFTYHRLFCSETVEAVSYWASLALIEPRADSLVGVSGERVKESGLNDSRPVALGTADWEESRPARDAANRPGNNAKRKRLLVVSPHVVQYSSPLYREIATHPGLDLLVCYCSMQGAEHHVDPGFGVPVSWDTPLFEGYAWTNIPNRARRPRTDRFWGLINPGLWRLIRGGHFDALLICGYYFASAWIAIAAAKSYGIPIIIVSDSHSLRSWRAQSAWLLRLKEQLVKGIFSLASAVVVSSSGGVEYLRSLGFPSERIVLAPSAVDNDWWVREAARAHRSAIRAAWRIPEEGSVILFCAKLQPWKAPMDLIEAFAQAAIPNSYLAFAGDGPERVNLERRAVTLGLTDRVRFLGFLNQSELPAAYRAADLFVLPSLFEPFGLVVNEAMLCGLPVVVSDRVGAKFDLIRPGVTGYVFPAGGVGALAAILKEILPDAAMREKFAAAAKRRMETWSPREYAEGLERAVDLVSNVKT